MGLLDGLGDSCPRPRASEKRHIAPKIDENASVSAAMHGLGAMAPEVRERPFLLQVHFPVLLSHMHLSYLFHRFFILGVGCYQHFHRADALLRPLLLPVVLLLHRPHPHPHLLSLSDSPQAPDTHQHRWRSGWNHKRPVTEIRPETLRLEQEARRAERAAVVQTRRSERLSDLAHYNRVNPVTMERYEPTTGRMGGNDHPHLTFADGKLPVPTASRVQDHIGPNVRHMIPPADARLEARHQHRRATLQVEGLVTQQWQNRPTVAESLYSEAWKPDPLPRARPVPKKV